MTTAPTDGRVVPTGPGAVAHAPVDPSRERTPLYVWTLLGTLVFSLFSGYSDLLGFPVGPDRLCFVATLVLLALDRDRPTLRWQPVHGVMVALLLWTTASALWAGTLLEPLPMYALLDRIAVPFTMFVLGPLVLTTTRSRRLLLWTMTLVGIYLGVTAVLEIAGPSSLVWPRYIMDPDVGILFGRARGPFAAAEANGMVLGICMFMAMALWPTARGWRRAIVLTAIPLSALGVVLSLTRSDWIATLVAGLVLGWLVPSVRRRLPLVVVTTVAAFAVFLALNPAIAAALGERLTMVSSVYDRQNTNAAAIRIVGERPLFGIGWGRYLQIGADWVRQADDYPVSNVIIEVHNVFLSRAAETGLPGAAMWVLAVILGPARGLLPLPRGGERRTWALILLATMCYWFLPSMLSPNSYPLPNNLMWLIGGVVAGAPFPSPGRPQTDPSPDPDAADPAPAGGTTE